MVRALRRLYVGWGGYFPRGCQRLPQPGDEAEHGRVLAREVVEMVNDGRGRGGRPA